MIFKVDRKYASMQKVAIIQKWDNVGGVWVYGFVLKRRSVATQEVCRTGGSVILYKSGELIGEACWCTEVRIQRRCEATGEVAQRRLYRRYVCLQEVCACIGGVLLEKRCVACYRGWVHVYESVWLGGMSLNRKYAAKQEVHACAGGMHLYRVGDIIWQVCRL